MITMALGQSSCESAPGTLGRAADRSIQFSLRVLNHHIRKNVQPQRHVAALVFATAWAINVGQAYDLITVERKLIPPAAQALSDAEHKVLLA